MLQYSALIALMAFLSSNDDSRAVDALPGAYPLSCTAKLACDAGNWALNKDGYALVAQLKTARTYQVCTRSIIVRPGVEVVLNLRVDGQVVSSSLGAERTYGCAIVTGKRIEIFNKAGAVPNEPAPALIGYVGGHYRRLGPIQGLSLSSRFHAPVTPKFEQVVIYRGPELDRARICMGAPQEDPQLPSGDWRRQSVVWVDGQGVQGASAGVHATFAAASCVDVEGSSFSVSRVPAPDAPAETVGYFYFGAAKGSDWEVEKPQ